MFFSPVLDPYFVALRGNSFYTAIKFPFKSFERTFKSSKRPFKGIERTFKSIERKNHPVSFSFSKRSNINFSFIATENDRQSPAKK